MLQLTTIMVGSYLLISSRVLVWIHPCSHRTISQSVSSPQMWVRYWGGIWLQHYIRPLLVRNSKHFTSDYSVGAPMPYPLDLGASLAGISCATES